MKIRKRKCASKDFNVNDLPQNRKQQFFDVLKVYKFDLIKLSFLFLLFTLPLFVAYVFKCQFEYNFYSEYASDAISYDQYFFSSSLLSLFFQLASIIFYAILCIGLAGTFRVIRQIAWGEGLLFWSDFKAGIKQNFVRYLLYSFVFDFFMISLKLCRLFYGYINVFTIITFTLLIIVIFPVLILLLTYTQIYNSSFKNSFKNCFIIYGSHPLIIIPTLFIEFSFFIDEVFYSYIPFIVLFFYLIIFIPVLFIICSLLSLSIFDKTMNKESYQEIYNKGLYSPQENTKGGSINEF